MSRPYQFSDRDDKITSPFDRKPQNQFPPGQGPSFKTDVNRSKTKKWVEAKQVSYGGDDWDDYDEDDEYGVTDAAPPAALSSQNRNFTSPVTSSAQASQLHRSNSFERGDERRAFSASNQPARDPPRSPGPPLHVDTSVPAPTQHVPDSNTSGYSTSANRQVSAASFAPSNTSDNSVNPENRRDFSPSAMPQPLKTPATVVPTRQNTDDTATKSPLSPASKARAFIRPADIYRRMEEEQEKERRSSTESSRSHEVASPRLHEPMRTDSPGQNISSGFERPEPRLESSYRMGAPLETVAERKSEYGMPGLPEAVDTSKSGYTGLSLPTFESGSTFGSFWDSPSSDKAVTAAPPPAQPPASADANLQHQPSVGYRSMVNQAFDSSAKVSKQDSTRSHAATDSSGITRSDTSGTTDISPIMSRVPSSAASAMKLHAEQQRDTPPSIAEEPEAERVGRSAEVNTPVEFQQGYRRDLQPPSGTNSPARSPAVEARKQLHDPATAEVLTSPASDKVANPSFREADLAAAAATSNIDKPLPPLADAEKAAQDTFVATHNLPAEASSNIARAESPTKGRVADLTGRFNEAEDTRRNSLGSRKSASSLQDSTSRPSSSHGAKAAELTAPAARPVAEREISFRPKLPGGFESYASTASVQETTASTPNIDAGKDIDLTPTTSKHPVESKDSGSPSFTNPMASLAAAGAAMGAAIQSAVSGNSGHQDEVPSGRQYGNIYNRPLPPDRMESTASTIPPTPPAKDEPKAEIVPAPITKDLADPPILVSQPTARSSDDFESDRIRRDIVSRLSPGPEGSENRKSLDHSQASEHASDRRSDVLSEYESYWADSGDDDEPKMVATALPTFSGAPLAPKASKQPEPVNETETVKDVPSSTVEETTPTAPVVQSSSSSTQRPGFLTQRFSWEMTPADSPVKEEPPKVDSTQKTASPSSGQPPPAPQTLKPDPLSLNPKLSSEHLQIRNAEPGELPSPEEVRGPSLDSIREVRTPNQRSDPLAAASLGATPTSPARDNLSRETPSGPRPPSSGAHDARPPSFREILAIKSTPARIAKYEETRIQFQNMDTGLDQWLKRTVAASPELGDMNTTIHRPTFPALQTVSTGSPAAAGRHKTSASLTRVFSGGNAGPPGAAENAPAMRPSPMSTGGGDRPNAAAAAAKGKELLNKAGVIGGKGVSKGMKEAKGLFAKGKSRFRGSGAEKAPFETTTTSPLRRRSSVSSNSSYSSQSSSVFSRASSRCESLDSSIPSRSVSAPFLDLTSSPINLCHSSSYSSLSFMTDERELEIPASKRQKRKHEKPLSRDDDDDADEDRQPWSDRLWTDDWLREQADITVMAIWSRHKPTPSEIETQRNTKMNAQRPTTPRANESTERLPGVPSPSLPPLSHLRPELTRNGSSDDLIKSVLKGSSGANSGRSSAASGTGALAGLPLRQAGSSTLSIPDVGIDKSGANRNSHTRIVSMIGSGDEAHADEDDPPSPVSPVDEDDRFPRGAKANADGPRPGALRSQSSNPRLPASLVPGGGNGMLAPSVSPMLRPQSAVGVGEVDVSTHPRVSFVLNEPKGKEKVGSSSAAAAAVRHIRFDSNTFHPRAKEIKLQKAKQMKDAEDAARKIGHRKQHSPPPQTLGTGTPRHTNFQQAVQMGQLPAQQQKRASPESGAFTQRGGLQRADSQYDRMAAIANAHRMMREQFDDDLHDVSAAPPDLMASETAARMHARQMEVDRMSAMMSGGAAGLPPVPPILEAGGRPGSSGGPGSRPQSSHGGRARDRASSGSFAPMKAERSRSREARPAVPMGVPGHSRESSQGRATSMPRLPPTGGPRASSIPRPESIVDLPGTREARRLSITSGSRPGTRDGSSTSLNLLTVSHGGTPVASPAQSGLSSLPSQQRPVSQVATMVPSPPLPSTSDVRLSAGPGPTIQESKSATSPTPSMVITTPEMVSTVQSPSPPSAKTQILGAAAAVVQERKALEPQPSIGNRSTHSVSSLENASDQSGATSPSHGGGKPVSPVKRSFEGRRYQAPDPQRERPMSFVPLARDDRGLPVAEIISTGKGPVGETLDEEEHEEVTSRPESREMRPVVPAVVGDKRGLSASPVENRRILSMSPVENRRNLSAQSDYEDDLYKPPTPKMPPPAPQPAPGLGPGRTSIAEEPDYEGPLSSNPVKHRSIQLYDRPFSRDDVGAGPPSEDVGFRTPQPDMNPIAHLQSPNAQIPKKGGLLSKLKGKPSQAGIAASSAHSQQSSRDTNSSTGGEQRLSSMTSTTASEDVEGKEKQRRRGSGFFSLKRPSSTEPESAYEPVIIPPHNQVRINSGNHTASSPQRAATTHNAEPVKKRRPTIGSLFSRSTSTNTPQQPPPPLPQQKESAKTTVFHRVPNTSAWDAPQEQKPAQQRFSGPRGQNAGAPPVPVVDAYGRRGSADPQRPPSFVHAPGASGMAAINAAQRGSVTTTVSAGEAAPPTKERRSMSLTGSGLFGRKRTDSSPSGHNRHRSNSAESMTKAQKKIRKRNMGSISENGGLLQHQERPWAITFPGAEDNEEDKEIERREIMHASSARWQRGPDGLMYATQEHLSPAASQSDATATPISPHTQPQVQHQPLAAPISAPPANPVFSYLPTGVPSQQRPASRDQHQEYYSPRDTTGRPPAFRNADAFDPEKPETYQPSQPVIPPLPQADLPLMQPQPRRTSLERGTQAVADPRRDPTYKSTGRTPATSPKTYSPKTSPPRGSVVAAYRAQAQAQATSPSDAPENRPPVPAKHSPPRTRTVAPSNSFIASLEEERRRHGDHTALGPVASARKKPSARQLQIEVPVTGGQAPPQVGRFEDTSAAVAGAGTSARPGGGGGSGGGIGGGRGESEEEDEAPVMQATSYPGQEWMPEFYYD